LIFNHTPKAVFTDLPVKYADGGRFYQSPRGEWYPSVTTVLSADSDKEEGIKQWRERIGEEEANKILVQASNRGESVHLICERYLNNDPDYAKGQMPTNIFSFKCIQNILDSHINNIHCQEEPLYSNYLKTAGRVDCLAEFDGKLSVIDFKTSRKMKRKEWISNYFMQTSAYAVMYEELTTIPVSQIVVIISVDGSEPQVFVEKRDDHIHDFIEIRKRYEELKNCTDS